LIHWFVRLWILLKDSFYLVGEFWKTVHFILQVNLFASENRMSIQNLNTFGKSIKLESLKFWCGVFYLCQILNNIFAIVDPFADAIKGSEEGVQDGCVHIRIQQRNGRKTLTTVQGLSAEYDLKKIVRACKKVRQLFYLAFDSLAKILYFDNSMVI